MMNLVTRMRAFAVNDEGQDLLEYALLIALIALVCVGVITTAGTNVQGPDSAEFAMELLRFPIRQVFGDTSVAPGHDAFVATITGVKMVDRFSLAQTVLGRNP